MTDTEFHVKQGIALKWTYILIFLIIFLVIALRLSHLDMAFNGRKSRSAEIHNFILIEA